MSRQNGTPLLSCCSLFVFLFLLLLFSSSSFFWTNAERADQWFGWSTFLLCRLLIPDHACPFRCHSKCFLRKFEEEKTENVGGQNHPSPIEATVKSIRNVCVWDYAAFLLLLLLLLHVFLALSAWLEPSKQLASFSPHRRWIISCCCFSFFFLPLFTDRERGERELL